MQPLHGPSISPISAALGRGAWLGLITGLLASVIYIACLALLMFTLHMSHGSSISEEGLYSVLVAYLLAGTTLMFGVVLGVLPALLAGPLTGMLIALLVRQWFAWLSQLRALVLGGMVCAVFSAVLLLLLIQYIGRITLFVVGLPMLMYFVAGCGISRHYYMTLLHEIRAIPNLPHQNVNNDMF